MLREFYRIRFHRGPVNVAGPYATLVATARAEAGAQMSLGWQQPPVTTDSGMNLGIP
ncbi:hypothetical protein N8I84_36845 [Streptomyces cynarae]|uniref:Uncharacterized protein n=1 Tax=Streptomyces cynarae TaxID=2981134 RepID=A0ABY6EAG3_9ACTN|nr:hypothetical protein [Streptomyces cynarae]UXY23644.1 hypothetical protein N8I84_36845 [Streptomyces cynarae]